MNGSARGVRLGDCAGAPLRGLRELGRPLDTAARRRYMAHMRDLGLTFAGGGNRAFYQQGLLEAWGETLWPRVAAVAGCSAGAAIATMLLSGRLAEARAHWDAQRRGLGKNIDLARALRGERIAPHGRIYRSTMIYALSDGGLARIRKQPFPVYILCSVPPKRMPVGVATWLGLGAYALEKRAKPALLHPSSGHKLGFRELVCDARDCETPEELADLVLASSSTPPFTPVGKFRGELLLDGGIVDSAPAYLVDRCPGVKRNIVLLTRQQQMGPVHASGKRLYLAPTEPIPIERWDYTEHAPVDQTLELGRRDALKHHQTLQGFLS